MSRSDVELSFMRFSCDDAEEREKGRNSLEDLIKTERGVQTLIEIGFQSIVDRADAGERGLATLLSRIFRYLAFLKLNDWDKKNLESGRGQFGREWNENKKGDMLRAVQYFALACPDKAAWVKISGWVEVALCCKDRLCGPAVLLLDALDRFEGLSAQIYQAAQSGAMLVHVISEGERPQKCAGVRVASRVVSRLQQGSPDASLSSGPPATWLKNFHEVDIVQGVVECINEDATDATVDGAVHFLAQLSKHKTCLKELRKETVLGVLLRDKVMDRFGTCMSELLQWILSSRTAANAFTAIGTRVCVQVLGRADMDSAVVKDMVAVLSTWLVRATSPKAANAFTSGSGHKLSLGLLDKVDLEATRDVLTLLVAWNDKRTNGRLPLEQRPDLGPLLKLLTSHDNAIANPACVLISWALCRKFGGTKGLIQGLDDEAISCLLRFLAGSSKDARYAVGALDCLITARVRDGASAGTVLDFGVIGRLFMSMSEDYPLEMAAGVHALAVLGHYDIELLKKLVREGAIRLLVAGYGEWGVTEDCMIVLALKTIISAAIKFGQAQEIGIPALKTVLEVSKKWPPSAQFEPFVTIYDVVFAERSILAELDTTLKEECIRVAVRMLGATLDDAVKGMRASQVIASILRDASGSLGQSFVDAGGPARLVEHVKVEDWSRNAAVRAVLFIANNQHLDRVEAELASHASTKIDVFCERFPPYTMDGALELQKEFVAAFGRAPLWPPVEKLEHLAFTSSALSNTAQDHRPGTLLAVPSPSPTAAETPTPAGKRPDRGDKTKPAAVAETDKEQPSVGRSPRGRVARKVWACANCGKTAEVLRIDKLRECSGCQSVRYCGKDCQSADWQAHRPTCKSRRSARQ